MDDVIFQVTQKHLNTGLRGYPVGTCRTSSVDPYKGLHYVGYPIRELAFLDPEAVIYLLLNKSLPTAAQDKEFRAELAERSAKFPKGVFDILRALPKEGHPMEWFMTGLIGLGMLGKTENFLEDGKNLIAWAPQVVAAVYRLRSGWGEPIPPDPKLGYVENFVHMLGVPGADEAKLTKLLRVFDILHFDHGGGNLSTFTGKAIASGLADQFASMAGAMAGLYGPRHGRANQDCLNFVREVGNPDPTHIESYVRNLLANGGLVFGFGHAVLRVEDPRADIQYELGKQLCPDNLEFKTALAMRDVIPRVLKENEKISDPYPNVDAVSGSLLNALGLTDSNFYTVLFGWSRCVGIAAQIIDERLNLRDGKGVAIYRCKYVPENQPERHL
ncbi:MAG: citrate synthase [Myxococcales bacterium]